ncbi:alpha-ketoglutarate-dependent dioxygenase AlkB [Maribacter polysiphoniae]|uniref:Alkylated DNA repair dioxygenase AlkB n=1 Tax=Maribacter polysiphoniae TaxID=429344 RepID=A0A316E1D3_9FLAO|nr:alpha-ketoglutarate-dependent dioxygenase AlkB [Maribacter polysiphoniae]MBD1260937.1 alpha-ketoglutarate-dependent dioxygenase AlkB [Maribacter polysiphoniae]PWK23925.1 alkylated DNA repair dioxygenase AlkB [Maribacter polysiphoniae]
MSTSPLLLNLIDADISYYPDFIDSEKAAVLFDYFKDSVPWQHDDIKVFGKVYPQPRLTALYGSGDKEYSYSNIVMRPKPFTENLGEINSLLEDLTRTAFNTCLLNFYRNGRDSNGWHSDDEKELGQNPVIASISLGQERVFHLRHKKDKSLKHKLLLGHGSLLLMKGKTQHYWQHQVPKTTKPIGGRINLTFRVLK